MAARDKLLEPSVALRNAGASPTPVMLVSWKDIANFFGKGVRTVQRWEMIGMPVHRPSMDRNIVFADPEELRIWAMGRRHKPHLPQRQRCEQLLEETRLTVANTRQLITRSQALLQRLREFS